MSPAYDLSRLDPATFEHLANSLALRVLGAGVTSFGPGPDGGRDGLFEGEAPYPSESDRWSGTWYIQSKFHAPKVSGNEQSWLVERVKEELDAFAKLPGERKWPDNWIVVTNIDPSGKAKTGTFDRCRKLVAKHRPALAKRFTIWGGSKVIDLLSRHADVAAHYGHFLTPGNVLSALCDSLADERASVEAIVRSLVVRELENQQHIRLEQAGSSADTRPKVHELFIDLPFWTHVSGHGRIVAALSSASSRSQRPSTDRGTQSGRWSEWRRDWRRARVWFVRGGPGQGKSTISQYFAQLHRAALILQPGGPIVNDKQRTLAEDIRESSRPPDWPTVPRIPITVELKSYAQWYGEREKAAARGVLTFLAERLTAVTEQEVLVGTLKRMLKERSWFVAFDGLDEVPQDVKDGIGAEVRHFLDDVAIETDADLLSLCTSRPQGYGGQFADLDACKAVLRTLSAEDALGCASLLIRFERSEHEAKQDVETLTNAMKSASIAELMTTPLQSHIMAVVVRGGRKPPERRWQLYNNFYEVMRRREADRDLPDKELKRVLQNEERLLKSVHSRLGFALHVAAETSRGALANMTRHDFNRLVEATMLALKDEVDQITVDALMRAVSLRLLFINTPDDGEHVRFDLRQLQEYFAGEFLYDDVTSAELRQRLELVAGDAHWREPMHFLLSALIENHRRADLDTAIAVLAELDTSENANERMLNRRLARGALIALRLLGEGVLDQNVSIRRQFLALLKPLFGSTEETVVKALSAVSREKARGWLLEEMFDALAEASPPETVGAIAVLASEYATGPQSRDALLAVLQTAAGELLRLVLYAQEHTDRRPSDLLSSEALHRLTGPVRLSGDELKYLLNWLRLSGVFYHVSGRDARETELLKWLLRPNRSFENDNGERYGILLCQAEHSDWTTGPRRVAMPQGTIHGERGSVLLIVDAVARFADSRGHDDFAALLNSLSDITDDLWAALPAPITGEVPIRLDGSLRSQIDRLRELSEAEMAQLLSTQILDGLPVPRHTHLTWSPGMEATLAQWRTLAADCPQIALVLWSVEFWKLVRLKRPISVQSLEAAEIVAEATIRLPLSLLDCPGLWGRLAKEVPSVEPRLRAAVLTVAHSRRPDTDQRVEFVPLTLSLPEEAALLPHLTNALLRNPERVIIAAAPESLMEYVKRAITAMTPNVESLRAIRDDPARPATQRLASMVLAWLHPEGKGIRETSSLTDIYDAEDRDWFSSTLAATLLLAGPVETAANRRILNEWLELTREDYAVRDRLDHVLTKWREMSLEPVTQAGVADEWLGLRSR